MIKRQLLSIALLGLLTTACGMDNKDPLKNYKSLQAVPATELTGPDGNIQYVLVENDKHVQIQGGEGNEAGLVALQNAVFQIQEPENMAFVEGQRSEFEFSVNFMIGQVKFDVELEQAPESSFRLTKVSQEVNKSTYKISWTPSRNILGSKLSVLDSVQIKLKDIQYVSNNQADNLSARSSYENLSNKTASLSYVVRKNNQIPTFTVHGLEGSRKVGEVHPFYVEVTAPESYTSEDPLIPEITYDLTSLINAEGFVEANGAYFVDVNPTRSIVETLGDKKWRIHYVFDTKNREMIPQYDRSLRLVEGADKLYVNLSLRVQSDKVAASDKKTLRFHIGLNE